MSLQIRNLTKAYGGLRVVDDVTISVPTTGITGIIGPNGVGKSTLFSLITGFIEADAGHLSLGGVTLDFLRLTPVADLAAGDLSSGQKKLLELGRALMTGARLILLDEPFAGVNPVLIEELSARSRGWSRRCV